MIKWHICAGRSWSALDAGIESVAISRLKVKLRTSDIMKLIISQYCFVKVKVLNDGLPLF
jgi:hypothetical protein